jgi:hypothetical protein
MVKPKMNQKEASYWQFCPGLFFQVKPEIYPKILATKGGSTKDELSLHNKYYTRMEKYDKWKAL